MNELARKKARRAELEWIMLGIWDDAINHGTSFVDWLERQAGSEYSFWQDEAKELIALYEES